MKFSMNASLFVRAIGAVSLACSTDMTRPHLNSVRIGYDGDEPSLDSFSFAATNGHVLFTYDVEACDLPEDTTVEPEVTRPRTIAEGKGVDIVERDPCFALLALADVTSLMRTIGKKPQGFVTVTISPKSVTVQHFGTTVSYPNVDAAFPPIKQVMPRAWSRTPLDAGSRGWRRSYP
jgi:DNA polymerase III sliding clamp (beta) subunit (PCNA family)